MKFSNVLFGIKRERIFFFCEVNFDYCYEKKIMILSDLLYIEECYDVVIFL